MPESRKPEDSPFKQQRLKAWQPILTPKWVIGTFALVGLIFVPIGIILKTASDDVVEYSQQYGGDGTDEEYITGDLCGAQSETIEECHKSVVTFEIKEKMEKPVYVYYELENFYQNHRRYVKSRSDSQLRGDELDDGSLSDCDPLKKDGDLILSPCGLIARSMFDDKLTLTTDGISMDETGIAWESDVDDKFKNPGTIDRDRYKYLDTEYPQIIGPPDQADGGVENEHFIVWMRTAGLPDFRKLYGKIDRDLEAGTTLTFNIDSRFQVDSFDGRKSIVISTTSWFGGKNPFLGIAYITVGTLCLFLSALFFIKHKVSPRPLGDTRYLVWKNRQ